METGIGHIFHPTDLSPASTRAFHHALRLALALRARITIMNVAGEEAERSFDRLPGVRDTLASWGVVPEGSGEGPLVELGIGVRKVVDHDDEPLLATLRFLERHPAELIVLANGQHEGAFAWLADRVSEPLARHAGVPALFVPPFVKRFVNGKDGGLDLKRVLLPVAGDPRPQNAVDVLTGMVDALGLVDVRATLFHAGPLYGMPHLDLPQREGLVWEKQWREGDAVEGILDAARAHDADLMVMTTKGHDGFLDMLRGDTTERVLRRAPCPLLAVPASWTPQP